MRFEFDKTSIFGRRVTFVAANSSTNIQRCLGKGYLPVRSRPVWRLVVAGVFAILTFWPSSTFAEDFWYVVRFDQKPVGYEHLKLDPIDVATGLRACHRRTKIHLRRLGQDLVVEASLSTTQTAEGQLQTFTLHRVDGSGTRTERSGRYNAASGRIEISEKVNATRRVHNVRTSAAAYSPIFSSWLPAHMKMVRRSVTVPVFFPETATVANVTANSKQNRTVRLAGKRPFEASQILFFPQLDPIKSTTMFVGLDDRPVLTEKNLLGSKLTIEQSTPEESLAAVTQQSLNLDVAAVVPVDRLWAASAARSDMAFDLHLSEGHLSDIPTAAFQKVRRLNASTIRVTLSPPTLPRPDINRTSSEALIEQQPTHWMPLNDATLRRLAAIGAAGQIESASVCQRLERFLNSRMKHSAFSTEIQPADSVAHTMRGDCTEHAVLLAALMRIRGVPSRIATGLVFSSRQYGFVGHAWVEAFVHGQWVPFDSTTGSNDTPVPRIKLADSEMPDNLTNSVVLFLPILEIAGRAKIHVVATR